MVRSIFWEVDSRLRNVTLRYTVVSMPTPRQHANQADRQKAYRERQKQVRTAEQIAKGLPPLPAIPMMPGTARWKALIEAARLQLEASRDEMQLYFVERSDSWQESEKADEYQARIDAIEAALSELENLNF